MKPPNRTHTTYPPPRLLKHPTSTMAFISSPLHIAGLLSALDVRQLAHSFTGALMQQSTFRNVDYDVHPTTGFFPSQPLQKLPSPFSLWEAALEGAQGAVSLGDDESDEALEKRQSGETWRSQVRSVSRHRHLQRPATNISRYSGLCSTHLPCRGTSGHCNGRIWY